LQRDRAMLHVVVNFAKSLKIIQYYTVEYDMRILGENPLETTPLETTSYRKYPPEVTPYPTRGPDPNRPTTWGPDPNTDRPMGREGVIWKLTLTHVIDQRLTTTRGSGVISEIKLSNSPLKVVRLRYSVLNAKAATCALKTRFCQRLTCSKGERIASM